MLTLRVAAPGMSRLTPVVEHRAVEPDLPYDHPMPVSESVPTEGSWETWEWDPSLFQGAARYYDFGRFPYAPGLADALREALNLDGTGRLLDLGCGPGTVTLRFASLFTEAIGVDPDPDMLAEAAAFATQRGVTNTHWRLARAEDLSVADGPFRVVTLAQSFHWSNPANGDGLALRNCAYIEAGFVPLPHCARHSRERLT